MPTKCIAFWIHLLSFVFILLSNYHEPHHPPPHAAQLGSDTHYQQCRVPPHRHVVVTEAEGQLLLREATMADKRKLTVTKKNNITYTRMGSRSYVGKYTAYKQGNGYMLKPR